MKNEKKANEEEGEVQLTDANADIAVPASSEAPQQGAAGLNRKDSVVNKDFQISYTQTRRVDLNSKVLMDQRVIAAFENDQRSEVYRQLRTRLLRDLKANNWRTLAITSAYNSEGKTLTAVNIAVTMAHEVNQTVLLVDLDFKGPNIMDVLGIKVEAGLVECLSGEVSLQDIMINPGLDRLVVVPSLPVTGHTSEILSSPKMKAILDEMINRYPERLIIFDLPPLLRDDDALAFIPHVDASLLVVESGGSTRAHDVERCLQLLRGTNVIGTVLNKLPEYAVV